MAYIALRPLKFGSTRAAPDQHFRPQHFWIRPGRTSCCRYFINGSWAGILLSGAAAPAAIVGAMGVFSGARQRRDRVCVVPCCAREPDLKGNLDAGSDQDEMLELTQLPLLPAGVSSRLFSVLDAFPDAYGAWDESLDLRKFELRTKFQPSRCSPDYGELNQMGISQLLHSANLGPEDAFVDVGSGLGKLVVVAAALTSAGVACGIELSPSRHKKAVRGAKRLFKMGVLDKEEFKRVRLSQGDCTSELPDGIRSATHLILTMRSGWKAAQKLIDMLRGWPLEGGRHRTIWSVGHWLPHCADMTYQKRYEIPGYFKPPREDLYEDPDIWLDEGSSTMNFGVHEYILSGRHQAVDESFRNVPDRL